MATHNKDSYDSDRNGSSTKDFILGALIGGAAGALAALFFAPKAGRELRNEINEHASSLKERSAQLTSAAKQKSSNLAEQAKTKTISLTDSVSQQTSGLVNKVKDITNNTRDYIDEKRDSLTTGPQTEVVTNEEIQRKLQETQKAFDDTESKLNQ